MARRSCCRGSEGRIDLAILLTGSYNWTRSAAEFNDENFLVTDEPRLVEAYTRQFSTIWDRNA